MGQRLRQHYDCHARGSRLIQDCTHDLGREERKRSKPPVPESSDARAITLRLDPKEMKVHHVQAVSFTAEVYSVWRHRFEKTDNTGF